MLQQTTVDAGDHPLLRAFLKRFPTVTLPGPPRRGRSFRPGKGWATTARARSPVRAATDQSSTAARRQVSNREVATLRSTCRELDATRPARSLIRLRSARADRRNQHSATLLPPSQATRGPTRSRATLLGVRGETHPNRAAGRENQPLMELGAVCSRPPRTAKSVRSPASAQPSPRGIRNRPRPEIAARNHAALRSHGRRPIRRNLLSRRTAERWAGMSGASCDFRPLQISSEETLKDSLTADRGSGDHSHKQSPSHRNRSKFIRQLRRTVTRYRIRLLCLVGELESKAASVKKTPAEARNGRRRAGDVRLPIPEHHSNGSATWRWATLADWKTCPCRSRPEVCCVLA